MKRLATLLTGLVLGSLLLTPAIARAQKSLPAPPSSASTTEEVPSSLPPQARGLDVEERIGQKLPMELGFTDFRGRQVRLAEYFQGERPAIILLVYYKCPIVCDVVMQKTVDTLQKLDYRAGNDYNLLVFSFDPTESITDARTARETMLTSYRRELPSDRGFEFHAGADAGARELADALGFKYRKLADGNYSHPVAKFIVTPDGKISRYLYGFEQEAADTKLALMEASQGKLVRTVGERIMNYCYMFDANSGKYTLRAMRVMQLGGLATLAALTALVVALLLGERLRAKKQSAEKTKDAAAAIG